jgi:hypothetical protein
MRPLGERTGRAYKPRAVDKEKESDWRKVFARFNRSELPFRKFCAQENISPNTFQYWRRELRKRDEARGITSTISKGDNRPSNLQQNIDYWLGIINEINAYEGSVRSYCRSHSIASGSLHFWEKRLKAMKLTTGVRKDEQPSDSVFVPVRILDDCSQPPEGASHGGTPEGAFQRIEIKLGNGVVMSLPVSTSVEVLIQLMNGVREHRC